MKLERLLFELGWLIFVKGFLTPSLPECMMEFCKMTITFDSADQILWCDHSNESSLTVLHSAICFTKFHKMKFGRNLLLAKFGSQRVNFISNMHSAFEFKGLQIICFTLCKVISQPAAGSWTCNSHVIENNRILNKARQLSLRKECSASTIDIKKRNIY